MINDCMGGVAALRPWGRGWVSTLNVRLLHAGVRSHLLHRVGWDSAGNGKPINVEDMVVTQLAFSIVLLLGLERVRLIDAMTMDEMGDYLHLWKLVGHLSGIAPEYNTHMDSVAEARMMLESIGAHQVAPDTSAPGMTWHVLECVSFRPPLPRTYAEMVAASRLMAGDTYADAIGIPSMEDPKLYPPAPPHVAAAPTTTSAGSPKSGTARTGWSLQRGLFAVVALAYVVWGWLWATCCGRASRQRQGDSVDEHARLQARKAQAAAGAGAMFARLRIVSSLARWPIVGSWFGWGYWRFTEATAQAFLGGRTLFPLRMLPKRVEGVTPHVAVCDSEAAAGGGVCPISGMAATGRA